MSAQVKNGAKLNNLAKSFLKVENGSWDELLIWLSSSIKLNLKCEVTTYFICWLLQCCNHFTFRSVMFYASCHNDRQFSFFMLYYSFYFWRIQSITWKLWRSPLPHLNNIISKYLIVSSCLLLLIHDVMSLYLLHTCTMSIVQMENSFWRIINTTWN